MAVEFSICIREHAVTFFSLMMANSDTRLMEQGILSTFFNQTGNPAHFKCLSMVHFLLRHFHF